MKSHYYLIAAIIVFGTGKIQLSAATLPTHPAFRVLIISDEVNPHGLSDNDLTQPGDISNALNNPSNGLNISFVQEIATNDIDQAIPLLSVAASDPNYFDVLIYFGHRIPNDATAQQNQLDQDNFTSAVESYLQQGGKLVTFHHGIYTASGKTGILDIVGGVATGSVPYNTTTGQRVIDVSPNHFITTNEIVYDDGTSYEDLSFGVPNSTYGYFDNIPDERYPQLNINANADSIQLLFASNYNQNGTQHILGFIHRRASWEGLAIFYQPGEYQPNALNDLSGNNFQILANILVYNQNDEDLDGVIKSQDCDDNDPLQGSCVLALTKLGSETFDFANPVSDFIDLSPIDSEIQYSLFNSLGETITSGYEKSIYISTLPNGIYELLIKTSGRSITKKVMVLH